MGLAESIATILGGAAVALAGGRACLWWIYRRGQVAERKRLEGEAEQRARAALEAEVKDLRTRMSHLEVELQTLRQKRRWT